MKIQIKLIECPNDFVDSGQQNFAQEIEKIKKNKNRNQENQLKNLIKK